MTKTLLLTLALLLGGCSTVVPLATSWPPPPGMLAQQPCPQLQALPPNPPLSVVATTVAQNYGLYYECAVKLQAWQQWYREQKILHESALQ